MDCWTSPVIRTVLPSYLPGSFSSVWIEVVFSLHAIVASAAAKNSSPPRFAILPIIARSPGVVLASGSGGGTGRIQQLGGGGTVASEGGRSRAHRRWCEAILAVRQLEAGDRLANLVNALRGGLGRRVEQQHELPRRIARRHVALAQMLAQHAPHLAQHRVRLRFVERERRDRRRRLRALGAKQLARQRVLEVPARGETGGRVVRLVVGVAPWCAFVRAFFLRA